MIDEWLTDSFTQGHLTVIENVRRLGLVFFVEPVTIVKNSMQFEYVKGCQCLKCVNLFYWLIFCNYDTVVYKKNTICPL